MNSSELRFDTALKDAGCSDEYIDELCRMYESGDIQAVAVKLRRYRQVLMDKLHKSQEEVDCLDYLLRKLSTKG